jgi:hypothetical protein
MNTIYDTTVREMIASAGRVCAFLDRLRDKNGNITLNLDEFEDAKCGARFIHHELLRKGVTDVAIEPVAMPAEG